MELLPDIDVIPAVPKPAISLVDQSDAAAAHHPDKRRKSPA